MAAELSAASQPDSAVQMAQAPQYNASSHSRVKQKE